MQDLALHLMRPLVKHPEAISMQVVEGDDVTILEAIVHPDDRAIFEDDGQRTLRAIRNVISAAAGREKATIELVESFTAEE